MNFNFKCLSACPINFPRFFPFSRHGKELFPSLLFVDGQFAYCTRDDQITILLLIIMGHMYIVEQFFLRKTELIISSFELLDYAAAAAESAVEP